MGYTLRSEFYGASGVLPRLAMERAHFLANSFANHKRITSSPLGPNAHSLSTEAAAGIDVRSDMDYDSRGSRKTGVGKSEVSYESMTSYTPLPMTVFRE